MNPRQALKLAGLLCSVLLPAVVSAQYDSPSAAGVRPDDDALRSYLGQSDLVVVGEILSDNGRYNFPEQFRVDSTIKGDPQTATLLVGDDRGWPGPNVVYPDGEIVLFLWTNQERGQTDWKPIWKVRDVQFGAMRATPALLASLKRLVAAETHNSGEDQLKALMRKFVPTWTIREINYTIGDQTYSTAGLVTGERGDLLDRREMKWVGDGPQSNNITYMHCPKLTAALWEYSNVQTAQEAQDYVKLVMGLGAGPRALENWTVKAEPYGDSWLVTPTYIGPPAQVRAVGPMELVFMNRAAGKVADIREWRTNFKPGQTARQRRQTGMNPDGLDPAPAELDDPTLDYYLSRSEMVVVGKVTEDVRGGFSFGTAIHQFGDIKVEEAIKGHAAPGSALAVDVIQWGIFFLKKDEELILFLSNRGGAVKKGLTWITQWDTDDLDIGALPASPEVLEALKRLAAAQGSTLETPNLYWGAETNGIMVRLQYGDGGDVAKLGHDFALNLSMLNRSSNRFAVASDQRSGELEVDGVWYAGPELTNVFNLPIEGSNNQFPEIQMPVSVGHPWRTEAVGIDAGGTPLKILPGTHRIRFAVRARHEPSAEDPRVASEVRAVSNPLEIEVREDTSIYRRSASSVGVVSSSRIPARSLFIYENEAGSINILGYTGSGGAVIIPDTIDGFPVTCIGSAFVDCETLESVKIPDSVTSIGDLAFSGCSSLESVTIPNRVTEILDQAFSDCSSLTSVTIPESVTRIESWAFFVCSSLTNLTIPAKVTRIGDFAFAHCTSLKKIYFKGNAPDTSNNIFAGATNTTVYYLPGNTGWGTTFGGRPTAVWKQ